MKPYYLKFEDLRERVKTFAYKQVLLILSKKIRYEIYKHQVFVAIKRYVQSSQLHYASIFRIACCMRLNSKFIVF